MSIEEFVEALKAIKESREVRIGFELQVRGQLEAVIDACGGANGAYEYFKKVSEAQEPEYADVEEN